MASTLLFIVSLIVVALFVYVLRYSGRLRVEQKRLIAAPLAEVYARVADLRAWSAWNPWLEHEPAAPMTFSGAPDGAGGRCAWDSEKAGGYEIAQSALVAAQRIEQRIRSTSPFRFRGRSSWRFVEREGQTEVTWQIRGRVAFTLRAFASTVQGALALDCRYGLDRLARVVEPAGAAGGYVIEYLGLREIAAQRYVQRTWQGKVGDLRGAMPGEFAALRDKLAAAGVAPAGEPCAAYVRTNIKQGTTVCRLAVPIGGADAGGARLEIGETPAHRAYAVRLTGGEEALDIAWYEAMQRLRIEHLQPDPRIPPVERYLGAPENSPGERVVELLLPVRAGASA